MFPFIWLRKLIIPMLKAAGVIKVQVKDDRDFSQPQSKYEKRHNIEMEVLTYINTSYAEYIVGYVIPGC